MCEPLGISKPLIINKVELSLTVVRFKCNLSVNGLAFENVIKKKARESKTSEETTSIDRCGSFHLNTAHRVIAGWKHFLNQAHWPMSPRRQQEPSHRKQSFNKGRSIFALFEVQVNNLSSI